MAFSKEISDYKNKIMNTIESDYELIRLIDESCVNTTTKTVINLGNLRYRKLFPYYFNPKSVLESISFVIMRVSTPRTYGKLIKDMTITITCASKQDIMKVDYGVGTRIDQMGACIDRLFNEKDNLGFGYLELTSNIETSIDENFRCRELNFIVQDFNNTRSNI